MADIDINNVICISLKSHNDQQLDAIGATYNISHEFLVKAKSEGAKKIWIHIGGGIVIAGLDTDNIDDVYFSNEYLPMTAKLRKQILNIKPVKTPKMPARPKFNIKIDVVDSVEVLDVDTILDKINALGITSLTKNELEFLNNLNK